MYELEGRVRHDLIGPGAVNAAQSILYKIKALRTRLHEIRIILLYNNCHMTVFLDVLKFKYIYTKKQLHITHAYLYNAST